MACVCFEKPQQQTGEFLSVQHHDDLMITAIAAVERRAERKPPSRLAVAIVKGVDLVLLRPRMQRHETKHESQRQRFRLEPENSLLKKTAIDWWKQTPYF